MLTPDRLRELLSYDPETGIFRWKKRSAGTPREGTWNTRYAGKVAGRVRTEIAKSRTSYVMISVDNRTHRAHRLAWLYVHGEWPVGEIDHRDCNGLNNAIGNLRVSDLSGNKTNCGLRSHNTSGIKGVSWDRCRKKWRADIMAGGHRRALGRFDSIELARAAYDAAALRLHGEFARINTNTGDQAG